MHRSIADFGLAAAFGVSALLVSRVDAAATTFNVLYSFCPNGGVCADGAFPNAGLTADSNGNLFGVTSAGGTNGTGAIFEMVLSGSTYTYQTLHSLDGNDGQDPATSLILDSDGNLYGTAEEGGVNSGGTAYELKQNATHTKWVYKVLYSFCGQGGSACSDGERPLSQLAYAAAASGDPYDGKSPLFGTTVSGGNNSGGTVFELRRKGKGWSERVLYSFCNQGSCRDGNAPQGDIAIDPSSGKLYGATASGGFNSEGTLYRLAPRSGAETVIYNFCPNTSCQDGSFPSSGVLLDSNILLGATRDGGAHGDGTVFRSTLGGNERVLYSLCSKTDCADGQTPSGPVSVFGLDLVGVAGGGVSSFGPGGVVYEIVNHRQKLLHTFCQSVNCEDGINPQGHVIAVKGNLFGVTQGGGRLRMGEIYEITP